MCAHGWCSVTCGLNAVVGPFRPLSLHPFTNNQQQDNRSFRQQLAAASRDQKCKRKKKSTDTAEHCFWAKADIVETAAFFFLLSCLLSPRSSAETSNTNSCFYAVLYCCVHAVHVLSSFTGTKHLCECYYARKRARVRVCVLECFAVCRAGSCIMSCDSSVCSGHDYIGL